jgi:hypothetical protein
MSYRTTPSSAEGDGNARPERPLHMKPWTMTTVMFLALALGCSDPGNPTGSGTGESTFFPSRSGWTWVYEVLGRPALPGDTVQNELTIRIISEGFLSNGTRAAQFTVTGPDRVVRTAIFRGDTTFFMSQTSDSVLIYGSPQDTLPWLLLRLPLELGESWQGEYGGFDVMDSVESKGDVTVPAGIFAACYQVRTTGGWWQAPMDQSAWYKDSVGIIDLSYDQVGVISVHFRIRLKSYNRFGPGDQNKLLP